MSRILSLNPNLDGLPVWKDATVAVASVDPDFHRKSRFGQVLTLLRSLHQFDLILIHNDLWLAAICSLFARGSMSGVRVALLGFYYAASPRTRNPREAWRHAKYRLMSLALHRIIVHTSAEVKLCSESLGIPCSRFEFVPYYAYFDAIGTLPAQKTESGKAVLIAPGRHRDFSCFCQSVDGLNARAVIVCGDTDLSEVTRAASGSPIDIYSEVSRSQYRELMAAADIVVIPLYADRWQRSLGQIALFDALLMRKPVVVARTFHLADYVSEGEVLFYEPGNAADLHRQLERLLGSSELREELTANAFRRVTTNFTEEQFAANMTAACQRCLCA